MPKPDFLLPPIPSRRAQRLDQGVHGAAYFAGNTALRNFLAPLGVTGYKAGITGRREVNQRIIDLRNRRYGSIVAPLHSRENEICCSRQGHEWFLTPIAEAHAPDCADLIAQIPGAEFVDHVFSFRIPAGKTIDEIDQRVKTLLSPRNLNQYLASADGRKRLRQAGFPAPIGLFTDYDLTGRRRRSLATEIFCIRPHRELRVLLEAIRLALSE